MVMTMFIFSELDDDNVHFFCFFIANTVFETIGYKLLDLLEVSVYRPWFCFCKFVEIPENTSALR